VTPKTKKIALMRKCQIVLALSHSFGEGKLSMTAFGYLCRWKKETLHEGKQSFTCVGGFPFPRKNPDTRTARGVSLLMAIYIGMLTPFKLARANATFAL
jgi:hypothetical protein